MSGGPTTMPWIPDPSCGDWVRARVDPEQFGVPWTIHTFVPRGFAAYARVFHPLQREVDGADARWSDVAAAFGTRMSPTANLDRLCGRPWSGNEDVVTPLGAKLEGPHEGTVPTDLLATVAGHLVRHTTTPDRGVVGVWEGHGDLVSSGRCTPAAPGPSPSDEGRPSSDDGPVHRVPGLAPPDPDAPAPGTGILDTEAAAGPRLELPYRSHVLFSVGIDRFSDRDWIDDAPWLDDIDRALDDPPTPAVFWPADRAWLAANDVDDSWTLVAGSRELVAQLVADPALEAYELREGATLDHADPPAR